MLRTLNIDPRVPTVHGVLIRRQALDEQVRAYITIKEARQHAKNIVKNALAKAADLENQAMKEGFQAGWLDSVNAISKALQDSSKFYEKIENSLKQSVQDTLQNTLQQPELALHLITGWLSANSHVAEKLTVILPKQASSQVEAIKRHVEEKTGLAPVVSVGEGDSVVILFNDQGYEFLPERTVGEINELVQQSFQKLEIRKQCITWSEEVMQNWVAALAQRYGDTNLSDASYEEKLDQELFGGFEEENFNDFDE